jgi:hypothetical protein
MNTYGVAEVSHLAGTGLGVVVGTTGDVTGLVVGVGVAGTVMYPLSANDLIILMTSALVIGELG